MFTTNANVSGRLLRVNLTTRIVSRTANLPVLMRAAIIINNISTMMRSINRLLRIHALVRHKTTKRNERRMVRLFTTRDLALRRILTNKRRNKRVHHNTGRHLLINHQQNRRHLNTDPNGSARTKRTKVRTCLRHRINIVRMTTGAGLTRVRPENHMRVRAKRARLANRLLLLGRRFHL